jgi:hypothetical protein
MMENWVEKEKGAEVVRALFNTYFSGSEFEGKLCQGFRTYIRNGFIELPKIALFLGLDKKL